MLMELKRIGKDLFGTYGVLLANGTPFAVTLENRWMDNKPTVSCIPPAPWDGPTIYICKRIVSPKFGETFEITDVKGRTHVLFHWGNRDDDTLGCVLVAEEFGVLHNETAILQSKKGFAEFMDITRGIERFSLRISWHI